MFSFIFSLDFLWWLILLLYVPACFALIIIVLLQKGKGVGFAGAFGMGGGSDTVFGPRSVKSLPQKLTYTAAGIFMGLALILSLLSPHVGRGIAPEEADEQAYMTGSAIDELMGNTPDTPQSDAASATETAPPAAVTVTPEATNTGTAPAETPAATPEATPAPAAETVTTPKAAPGTKAPAAR